MTESDSKLWYKDAVIYQAHVRSFKDSNGDGIGDFKGFVEKLDYLKSLGVNAVWILPFYKSPLKDGGYDISDFTDIHEDYGTMADFKLFIREAHKRGLRVITELVLNHTSSAHKWFERARRAKPGSVHRDFYVWSDTTEKYKEARIIFQDFETSNWSWDPVAQAYYWHRFYSHQPDLNFDNPAVHKAVFKVLDFWFKMGIDGLRLDAVPYLYEREGTNCENLPETHQFLKKLRKYIDDNFEDKMLLAEANQWPEDAAEYFGEGDECHMSFHFPLMPRLYMAMRMEDRFPLIDILDQTPAIPENCQWAIFLRNHDELTLEMVTDEERDYMYKSFAQNPRQRINLGIRRRLAPLLSNDRKSIELINILLFSMPGTPIVYYGDEIGMGDNYYLGDRDGMRTPMQWSSDKNAGFSSTEPQRLFLPVIYNHDYHYESINVENQERNPTSLLWWMRRVVAKRKQYKAFSRGSIEFIDARNPKILAFIRKYNDETILVVINLSRYSQQARLNLSGYEGYVPVELFSRNHFAPIGEDLYNFPLQFKNYFWFELHQPRADDMDEPLALDYQLTVTSASWHRMNESLLKSVHKLLNEYIQKIRWFSERAKKLRAIAIDDIITLKEGERNSYIVIITSSYIGSKDERYLVLLSIALGEEMVNIRQKHPKAVIAQVNLDDGEGLLYDGAHNEKVREILFGIILQRSKIKNNRGFLAGLSDKRFRTKVQPGELPLPSRVLSSSQSNTSLLYDQRFFLKLYRTPEPGSNPEPDVIRALTKHTSFRNFPAYAGALEYSFNDSVRMTLGLLVDFVPNEGNAWGFARRAVESFFDRVDSAREQLVKYGHNPEEIIKNMPREAPVELFDPFFIEMVELLGKRTAEMHMALASIKGEKEFAEEPFSLLYQKSLYQSFRTLIRRTLGQMKDSRQKPDAGQSDLVDEILQKEEVLLSAIKQILERKRIHTSKIRIHGDYHLRKVLFTGKDFVIIDFEGEPTYSLTSTSLKYCPFKDVAGMLSSFNYVVYMGYLEHEAKQTGWDAFMNPWVDMWYRKVVDVFLNSYLKTAGSSSFIPSEPGEIEDLLLVYTIEKAIYRIDYEFNNRPDMLHIPLNGVKSILTNLFKRTSLP